MPEPFRSITSQHAPTCLIVGGGPAGSIAGILLGRAGKNVTLVEQHRFPRDKVCGECISALGFAVIDRLGLRDDFQAAGCVRLDRAILYSPDGASASLPLLKPMWGLSRCQMDHLLLRSAEKSGITLLQPARCEAIEFSDQPVAIVRDLLGNHQERIAPDWILLADGKGALLPSRPGRTDDFGLKAHFTDIAGPRDAIELFGTDHQYGGLAPIENDRWNLAFSIDARMLDRFHGDLDRIFQSIIGQNRALQGRFNGARRVSGWLVSPLPRFAVSRTWPRGMIPLGNAAAALEPIGGEGMGLAMRSAEMAADFLLRSNPAHRTALRRDFQHLWRARRIGCRAAARVVSAPSLAALSIDFLASSDAARRLTMRLMGKQ